MEKGATEMKTSELTGDALVCAVAKCEGYTELHKIPGRWAHEPQWAMMPPRREYGAMELWEIGSDRDWGFFGPIIEREFISLSGGSRINGDAHWHAIKVMPKEDGTMPSTVLGGGPTPLIAAMRCYVASKLGDEVDIPEELTESKS
jgi:hypothetical protein